VGKGNAVPPSGPSGTGTTQAGSSGPTTFSLDAEITSAALSDRSTSLPGGGK
jgi:hypothetical protein